MIKPVFLIQTNLRLTRPRAVACVNTTFEKIATIYVVSFASGASPTSHRTLYGAFFEWACIFNSFFLFNHVSPFNSSIFDYLTWFTSICPLLYPIFIYFSYSAASFPTSSYSSFSPPVDILETPRSVPFLPDIPWKHLTCNKASRRVKAKILFSPERWPVIKGMLDLRETKVLVTRWRHIKLVCNTFARNIFFIVPSPWNWHIRRILIDLYVVYEQKCNFEPRHLRPRLDIFM